MRKETREKDGRTYFLRYYRDWLDFVSFAERVNRESDGTVFGGMRCSSLDEGERDWFGSQSLTQAIELAYRGWPEGREMVRDARKRMQVNHLLPRAQRIVRQVDVFGDEPDIDLFLCGEPEHMATLHETINPQYGKVLRFVLSRSAMWTVPTDCIVRRGVATLIAIEVLLVLGYAVEISIVQAVDNRRYHHYEQYEPILHAGDPINLDTFAFMFMHASVLRRLCFAAEECESQDIRQRMAFANGGGYGRPCTPTFLPSHDLFLDWEEGLLCYDNDVAPYALKLLERVGVNLAENA